MSAETAHQAPTTVTLKQVAEAAKVSLATASYSLNGGGSVGAQTRERVKATAQRLGYRPNVSAKAMRTGRTGALGLILPDLTNPFFPQLAQTVIVAARNAGYEVFLTDTLGAKDIEAKSMDTLVQRGVDGLIWFPIDDTPPPDLRLQGTPTVVLDRLLDGFDCIVADCYQGGRAAASLLLARGHLSIGIVSGPSAASSARQRAQGARDEITARGGRVVWEMEAAFSVDLDAEIVQQLARRNVSAIVAGSDLIAIGLIRELGRLGLGVPGDVSVVGFDNIPFSELLSPALTTIEIPVHEMGAEAVQLLLRRMAAPSEARRRVVYEVSPVSRGSVGIAGPGAGGLVKAKKPGTANAA